LCAQHLLQQASARLRRRYIPSRVLNVACFGSTSASSACRAPIWRANLVALANRIKAGKKNCLPGRAGVAGASALRLRAGNMGAVGAGDNIKVVTAQRNRACSRADGVLVFWWNLERARGTSGAYAAYARHQDKANMAMVLFGAKLA